MNKNTSANKTVHAKPQPPSFAWLQIGGGTSHGGGARLWPGVRRQRGISTRPRQARVCPGPLLYFFFFFFFFWFVCLVVVVVVVVVVVFVISLASIQTLDRQAQGRKD